MAKVRNEFGYAVEDIWGGRMVEDEHVIEVPDDQYEGYVLGGWAPVDEPRSTPRPTTGRGAKR